MIIEYRDSFKKDLLKIKETKLFTKIIFLIEQIKKTRSIEDISNIKKLKGYKNYYRIRLGDYRIGIIVTNKHVIMIRILHRKEIYRYFP
ncbi:MAG: type II toxin-antitoxin system RelE/ParE family toxin [Bacteroidota bacterium]|nr:type II toxin-antitoxin system RelE/ParE family toxin [Bacteroidota bacterium]